MHRGRYEANLSAVHSPSRTHPRVPCAHENARWARRHQCAPCAGSRAFGRLRDAKSLSQRVPDTGVTRQEGFGKNKRIRSSAEFEALLRDGTRRSFAGFTFFFLRRPTGPSRLGILISRKHAPLSKDRNRIKRCIREAFRQTQGELGALDLLVRPPYSLKPSTETVGRLRSCLERLAK